MKIEAGKHYLTRDGKKAFVLGVNLGAHEREQVIGWVGKRSCSWYIDGQFLVSAECNDDLIEEWREPIVEI